MVQTEDGVKSLADFVLVVLVLGQLSAWGAAKVRSTSKCVRGRLRFYAIDVSKPGLPN